MLCNTISTRPASTARPMMLAPRGPPNISGKRVRISMRTLWSFRRRFSGGGAGRPVVARFAAQALHGVGQGGEDGGQVLAHPLLAPRQVDDEGAAADPGQGAAEHGHWGVFQALQSHGLGDAGHLPFYHGESGFRRHVARAETRPTGGEYQVQGVAVGPGAQARRYFVDFVRHHLVAHGAGADAAQHLLDGGAAGIAALPPRTLIADREDAGPDLHLKSSRPALPPASAPS